MVMMWYDDTFAFYLLFQLKEPCGHVCGLHLPQAIWIAYSKVTDEEKYFIRLFLIIVFFIKVIYK